jgi:hypothetical protein
LISIIAWRITAVRLLLLSITFVQETAPPRAEVAELQRGITTGSNISTAEETGPKRLFRCDALDRQCGRSSSNWRLIAQQITT